MSTTKEDAIRAIRDLPEDASIDDILEALYLQEQIERGIRDLEAERTVSHGELRERVQRWRQSAGR